MVDRYKTRKEFSQNILKDIDDQRIGQLIINAIRFSKEYREGWKPEDLENILWNIYDEDLIKLLKELKNGKSSE